ncbi:MAG: hypothetical protein JWM95_5121 [Gemmatimonadetes bacterium]|nr:hypothetical protein [Gemmatimonadota bacterium]
MLEFLQHAVERYGYFAIALIVTLEGFGLPLPGETAVVSAAAFASRGSMSVVGVAIAAAVGALLGGSGGYWIGRIGGRPLLLRYQHLIHIDGKRIARAEAYFKRHGVKTVFFARFIALLRIFGSLFAGVAHMPFVTFTLVNLAGGVLWAATFSALGYSFGRNLPLLEDWLGEISLALSVMVVIAIVWFWRRNRTQQRAD